LSSAGCWSSFSACAIVPRVRISDGEACADATGTRQAQVSVTSNMAWIDRVEPNIAASSVRSTGAGIGASQSYHGFLTRDTSAAPRHGQPTVDVSQAALYFS